MCVYKDANESDIKVQVCIYAFDLLYINGESLVSRPLRHRRDTLRSSFPQVEGEFTFASSLVTSDTDRVAEFLEESIKGKFKHSSTARVLCLLESPGSFFLKIPGPGKSWKITIRLVLQKYP